MLKIVYDSNPDLNNENQSDLPPTNLFVFLTVFPTENLDSRIYKLKLMSNTVELLLCHQSNLRKIIKVVYFSFCSFIIFSFMIFSIFFLILKFSSKFWDSEKEFLLKC